MTLPRHSPFIQVDKLSRLVLPHFLVDVYGKTCEARYKPTENIAKSHERTELILCAKVLEFFDGVCSLLRMFQVARLIKVA